MQKVTPSQDPFTPPRILSRTSLMNDMDAETLGDSVSVDGDEDDDTLSSSSITQPLPILTIYGNPTTTPDYFVPHTPSPLRIMIPDSYIPTPTTFGVPLSCPTPFSGFSEIPGTPYPEGQPSPEYVFSPIDPSITVIPETPIVDPYPRPRLTRQRHLEMNEDTFAQFEEELYGQYRRVSFFDDEDSDTITLGSQDTEENDPTPIVGYVRPRDRGRPILLRTHSLSGFRTLLRSRTEDLQDDSVEEMKIYEV